jgi:hypothetical protein
MTAFAELDAQNPVLDGAIGQCPELALATY